MKRRNFIQLSAISGAIPFLGVKACAPAANESANQETPEESTFELEEWTVAQLREAMESGKYSSKQICELYLSRIKEKDQSENGLNSVIEVNPDALSIAEQLDQERADGKVRGPLHGIPIMIKDNIDTGDKMMTTAGSLALVGSTAPDDAFIVKQLREAGMVFWKDQLERVGQLQILSFLQWMEWKRRANKKPFCAGSQSVWIKCWFRCCRFRKHVCYYDRNRDKWLDRLSFFIEWNRRN